jgi:malate dehydrogenase
MSLPKITVVGAGNVGATTAQLLLERNLADVVMVDVAVEIAQGKALDLMHMRGALGFSGKVTGTGDYSEIAGSDIVVVTAGVPRKPNMTREDLLLVNARIIKDVMDKAVAAAPDAIYIIVTNPLDVMVNYAWQISGLPRERIIGMGGVLDSARFVHAIASRLDCDPKEVDALVIGAHGEAMQPMPRLARVMDQQLSALITKAEIDVLVEQTVQAGAQVVGLLGTGSAYYAPAASIVTMIEEILQPTGRVLSACAGLTGQYYLSDVHIGVPVKLGRAGVLEIFQLMLSREEQTDLIAAARSIEEQLALII